MVRLFVNQPGFDNVGEVLSSMGPGFEFRPAEEAFGAPPSDVVLFLNCGGPVPFADEQLRRFMEAGGTLYLSDLQADLAERLCPGVFKASPWTGEGDVPDAILSDAYGQGGSGQIVHARVVDLSMRDIIGGNIDLKFDMGGWKYLAVGEYGRGTSRVFIEAAGNPLVVSYGFPKGGSLFFTAFHNRAQDSKKEQDLLRFLLFRPMLSRAISQSVKELKKDHLVMSREYTGGLWKGAPVKEFVLPADGVWTARLSWSGQGRLSIELVGTSGQVLDRKSGARPPLEVKATASAKARIRVLCDEFIHREIPFCLLTATGGAAVVGGSRVVLSSHPISRPGFDVVFGSSEKSLDLSKTKFQVRASLERQEDGTVQIVVHPGAEIRVQPPGTKHWTVERAGSRVAAVVDMVFFDNQGKATARVSG